MSYYERHLPHWQPEGAAVFITWRLRGSLPRERAFLLAEGQPSGQAFAAIDQELAKSKSGPRWLEEPRIAQVVYDALIYGEEKLNLYERHAWVILPNHVHILIYPTADLPRITRAIKNYSAREANKILGRSGKPFWQNESYDHWVRNEDELNRIVKYVEANPVAAGLAQKPEDWRWSSGWAGQEAYPTVPSNESRFV